MSIFRRNFGSVLAFGDRLGSASAGDGRLHVGRSQYDARIHKYNANRRLQCTVIKQICKLVLDYVEEISLNQSRPVARVVASICGCSNFQRQVYANCGDCHFKLQNQKIDVGFRASRHRPWMFRYSVPFLKMIEISKLAHVRCPWT